MKNNFTLCAVLLCSVINYAVACFCLQ